MRKKIFFILIVLFCFYLERLPARIFVMGYPKSGNNLICYSLGNILNKAVLLEPYYDHGPFVFFLPNALGDFSYREKLKDPVWASQKIKEVFDDAIFFGHHSASLALHTADQASDYLIVIMRDYHECFIRNDIQDSVGQLSFRPEQMLDKVKNLRKLDDLHDCYNSNSIDIINIAMCYDLWNPKKRVLIYYEDLLADFESEIRDCLIKLNIADSSLDCFLLHKTERIEESRKNYLYGEAMSGGDTKYHQKKRLPSEIALKMDEELRLNFPDFWIKYFSRYAYSLDLNDL